MDERLLYCNMRKLALMAREKIGRERLLTETDRVLRNSRDLISGTQELKTLSAGSQQPKLTDDDHQDRTDKTVRVSDSEIKVKGMMPR
jgi:hypothetical protein